MKMRWHIRKHQMVGSYVLANCNAKPQLTLLGSIHGKDGQTADRHADAESHRHIV